MSATPPNFESSAGSSCDALPVPFQRNLSRHARGALPVLMLLFLGFSPVTAPLAQEGFQRVAPAGTWLKADTALSTAQGGPDRAMRPTSFSLRALGVKAGDRIALRGRGDAKWERDGRDSIQLMIAVFRDGSRLVAPAAPRPPRHVTMATCPRGLPTDVPEDFGVPWGRWLVVVVPAGADNIAFSTPDCFWKDNTDPDRDFGVEIVKR